MYLAVAITVVVDAVVVDAAAIGRAVAHVTSSVVTSVTSVTSVRSDLGTSVMVDSVSVTDVMVVGAIVLKEKRRNQIHFWSEIVIVI
jgi:hypothetical protein